MKISNKSIFSRILAQENITILEKAGIPTASFDLNSRTIYVPHYDDKVGTKDILDMMLVHEISHAIYTPAEYMTFSKSIADEKQKRYAQSFLNVVEDCRIDKLIKKRYSPLVSVYARSSHKLKENDFFKLKEGKRIVNDLPFIDRINLYFKVDINAPNYGASYNVQFSEKELKIVYDIKNLATFDDVKKMAKFLLENYLDDVLTGSIDDLTESDTSNESSGKVDGLGEGRFEIHEDDFEERTDEDEEKEDTSVKTGGLGAASPYTLKEMYESQGNMISNHLNVAVSKSRNNKVKDFVWSKRPQIFTKIPKSNDSKINVRKDKNYVNLFVSNFLRKVSARNYAQTTDQRVGMLEGKRIFKYKITDDIFKRKTILGNQENHGFLFLIDCSSSMDTVFKDLVNEMAQFTEICTKLKIPFKFIGFTTSGYYGSFNSVNGVELFDFPSSDKSYKENENILRSLYEGNINMGGTPTSEAILGIIPTIEKMASEVDILNFVVFTDGQEGSEFYNVWKKAGAQYVAFNSPRGVVDNSSCIYKILRDFYNIKVHHFDITKTLPFVSADKDQNAFFQKNGFLVIKELGGANNAVYIKNGAGMKKSRIMSKMLSDILS